MRQDPHFWKGVLGRCALKWLLYGGTYLSGWNHDTNLFNSFCKFFWLNSAVVVEVKVFERSAEDLFFRLYTWWFLLQLVLQFFLEAKQSKLKLYDQIRDANQINRFSHAIQVEKQDLKNLITKWLTLLLNRPFGFECYSSESVCSFKYLYNYLSQLSQYL